MYGLNCPFEILSPFLPWFWKYDDDDGDVPYVWARWCLRRRPTSHRPDELGSPPSWDGLTCVCCSCQTTEDQR